MLPILIVVLVVAVVRRITTVVVIAVLVVLLVVGSHVFATLGAVSLLAVRSRAIFFFAIVLATVLIGGVVLLV